MNAKSKIKNGTGWKSMVKTAWICLALAGMLSSAGAQTTTTLYWDANGDTGGTGGSGTWDLTSPLWRLNSTSGPLQTWTQGTPTDRFYARFEATTGTVTIANGVTVDVNQIFMNTGDYRISGGAGSVLNFVGGATAQITGNSSPLFLGANAKGGDVTLTGISLNASGNFNLTGRFTNNVTPANATTLLSGKNSFETGIDLTAGRLMVSSSQNLGGDSAPLILRNSSATFSVLGTELTGFGSRTVTFSSGLGGNLTFDIQDGNNTFTLGQVNNNTLNSTGAIVFTKTGQGTLDVITAQGWENTNSVGVSTAFNGGTLRINAAAGGSLKSGGKLAFGGGTLELLGRTSNATTQTLGNVRLNAGGGEIVVNNNNGTEATTLNLGNFTLAAAANGSSLNIRSANVGDGFAVVTTTQLNDASGIVGAGRIIYSGTNSTGNAIGFATNTGTEIGAYTGATPFVAFGADGAVNYQLSGSGSVTASESVNTLKLTSTAASQSLAIGAGQILTVNTGGLLFTGANDYSITGGTLRSNTATNSDLVIQQYGAGALTIGSEIANGIGTSVLTKAGPGTLVLTAANTYTGSTFVNGGVLSISAANNLGVGSSALNLNNGTLQSTGTFSLGRAVSLGGGGGTFDVADGQTLTLGSAISGGRLTLNNSGSGSGVLLVTAGNSFTGGVAINSGTLRLGTNSALNGFGANTLSFGSGSTATLQINGARNINVAGLSSDNADAIVENGAAGAATLRVNNGGDNTYAGKLQDGAAGTLGLIKEGSGALTLTGTNTYTGATTITGGTLMVNGSLTASNVSVNAGGALGGSGAIAGAVTVNAGGMLSPGNSIESLGTGSIAFNGGELVFELNTSAVTADLLYGGAGSTLTLSLSDIPSLTLSDLGSNAVLAGGAKFTLISYDGAWNGGIFSGYADDSTFSFANNTWLINYNDTTAGSNFVSDATAFGTSFVTLTVVPEPSTYALLGGGLAVLLLLRRRRGGKA